MTRTPLRREHVLRWERAMDEWRARPFGREHRPPRLVVEIDQGHAWVLEQGEPELPSTMAEGQREAI